ncbi:MAG: Competence protein A [candidate division BRC1 bacterium ADurb.BinA364]|nr:MAG: Competence protein A [candidate division BRC1 bacterium ADurb.BinA364]
MAKKNSKLLLAVDVTMDEARMALAQRAGARWRAIWSEATPLESQGEKAVERKEALRAALVRAKERCGRTTPLVYAALPKDIVFMRMVDAPKVRRRRDLRGILQLRAAQEIPYFSEQDVHWDYEVLPGYESDAALRVVISAVRRDALERYLEDFAAVGLKPAVVDIRLLALTRWFLDQRRESEAKDLAIVDSGGSHTSILFVENGRIRHFGQAPISAGDIRRNASAAPYRFVLEFQTALDSFQESEGEGAAGLASPSEAIFCGRTDIPDLLGPMLEERIGTRARRLIDCVDVDGGAGLFGDESAPADCHILEGLFWRALSPNDAACTNFVRPVKGKSRLSRAFAWATNAWLLLGLALAMAAILFVGGRELSAYRQSELQRAYDEIKALAPDLARMEATLQTLNAYSKERFSWLEILAELDRIQPSGMELRALNMEKNGRGSLQGVQTAKSPIQIIENFNTQLNESPYFENAVLGTTRRGKDNASFSITFQLQKRP